MKKVIFIFLFIFTIVDAVNAQGFYSSRRDRTTMLSFGLGLSNYNGDLHDVIYDGLTATPNAGIGLRKKLGSQLSFRLDFNWYQISGADSSNQSLRTREIAGRVDSRRKRNLSFRSNNLELSGMFLFNLVPINNSYTTRPILNPYIFAGIGLSTNNPKTFYEGDWVPLRPLQTELTPYPGRVMVIPIGFGVRVKATESVDILLEAGYRRTFTDYLDDVSTDHVDKSQFDVLFGENTEKSALAKALTDRSAEGGYAASKPGDDRGNPLKNDSYYIFQVRLEMYLGSNFIQELFSPSRKQPKFR